MWLKRLEAVEPFLHTWLSHQTRDAYWRHGSVCEDYGAIRAAVLAVGGWHDPYRDTVLRLAQHLPQDRVRGIIGPWSHQYPDRGLPPGPAIGFLQETLRWWDHHLKDVDNDVMAEPLLRSWISDSHLLYHGVRGAAGPLGHRPLLALPERHPRQVRLPGRARRGRLAAADRARRGPLLPLRQRRRPAARPARRGRPLGLLRLPGPGGRRPRRDPRPPVGEPRPAHGRPDRAGHRPALRHRPRRLLHARHPGRAELLRPLRPRPGRGGPDRRDGELCLRPERHRPRLRARPPGASRGLLHVLAVDLAAAGRGGLHSRPGGLLADPAGAPPHRGRRPMGRAGAVGAARRGLPAHPGGAPPGAGGGQGRGEGRVDPGGRPEVRRYARVPGRPGVHRGRRGDLHDRRERPAVRPHELGMDDPAAPPGAGLGRHGRHPLGDHLRRGHLPRRERGGVQGGRRGRLPPDVGEDDPRTAG